MEYRRVAEAGEGGVGEHAAGAEGPEAGEVEIDRKPGIRHSVVVEIDIVPGGKHPVRRDGHGGAEIGLPARGEHFECADEIELRTRPIGIRTARWAVHRQIELATREDRLGGGSEREK